MYPRLEPDDQDPRLASVLAGLRELPAEARPPFDWLGFRERVARGRSPASPGFLWRQAALAAGSIAVAIGAVALWNRVGAPVSGERIAQQHAERQAETTMAQWHRPDVAAGWLEALPDEPAIVRMDTHMAVTELEDSIAWVDELLTLERAGAAQPARVMALQRERSRLVDSLVRVRYAETLAAEMH